MKYTYYTLLAVALLATACKKTKETPAINTYVFANRNAVTINAVLYRSLEDYGSYTHPIVAIRMDPGDTLSILYNSLSAAPFFIDYYTDDYTYSNWSSYSTTYTDPDRGICEAWPIIQCRGRKVLLGNTGTRSTWKAVDALAYNHDEISVWDQLTEDQKNIQLTVTRDYHADLTLQENGVLKNYPLGYIATHGVYTHDFMFSLVDTDKMKEEIPLGYIRGKVESTTSDDTIILRQLFYNNSGYNNFVLVKQP